jgi:hypothetical protein
MIICLSFVWLLIGASKAFLYAIPAIVVLVLLFRKSN